MPRHKTEPKPDPTEDAIRRAGSIGALERLAGIGSTQEERAAFWEPYCKRPGAEGLDAGVSELRRRIRAQAQPTPRNRRTRVDHHA